MFISKAISECIKYVTFKLQSQQQSSFFKLIIQHQLKKQKKELAGDLQHRLISNHTCSTGD